MKRIAAAAAAVVLAVGTAHAQQLSQVYGELGYTWLKIDAASTSARPGAIRGVIGYEIHPYFTIEGMAAAGVNDSTKGISVGGVPTQVSVDLSSMYGIFIKPRYLVQGFEVFGRFGYAHTKVNTDSRAPSINGSQSDNDFAWGLGANYYINPRTYVGLDWMRYSNQSGHKVDGMTLGLGYHW